MTKIEIFQAMRDKLMTDGWCQESLYHNDKTCLVGAFVRVSGVRNARYFPHNSNDADRWEALDSLGELVGLPYNAIATWNDSEDRTFNEVIDLLDLAILQEKEKKED